MQKIKLVILFIFFDPSFVTANGINVKSGEDIAAIFNRITKQEAENITGAKGHLFFDGVGFKSIPMNGEEISEGILLGFPYNRELNIIRLKHFLDLSSEGFISRIWGEDRDAILFRKRTQDEQRKLQQFDEQFDQKISGNVENNQALKEALQKIKPKSKSRGFFTDEYGGEAGRQYFKIYNESVIQPTLLATLKEMKETKDDDPELFIRLLYKLGQQRGEISDTVGGDVESASYYGKGTPMGKMDIDRIGEAVGAYNAWYKYLEAQMTSGPLFGKVVTVESSLGNKRIALNTEEFNRLREVFGGPVEKSVNGYVVKSEPSHIFGVMSVPVEIFTRNGKNEYYINLAWTYISHRLSSLDELKKLVAPYFYKALNSSNEEDLKNALGMLLLRMSHQTVFARGQAGVTLWLLQGLARAHGDQLKFSPEWQGPDYPNPDMHALSSFNEDKFLEEFKKNAFFEPISDK